MAFWSVIFSTKCFVSSTCLPRNLVNLALTTLTIKNLAEGVEEGKDHVSHKLIRAFRVSCAKKADFVQAFGYFMEVRTA